MFYSTWMLLLVDMLAQYVEVEKLGLIYVCEKCNGKNNVLLLIRHHILFICCISNLKCHVLNCAHVIGVDIFGAY